MGLFDSVTQWLGNNSGWLAPAAALGFGGYSLYQQNKAQNDYEDALREREERNYENALSQYEAGQEGAAAQQAMLEQAAELFKPYYEQARILLPAVSEKYRKALESLDTLGGSMMTPEFLASTKLSPASWVTNPQGLLPRR